MTAPVLEVKRMVAGYRDLDILRGVSLRLDAGEVVTVIGPNGSGKSTLLKAILGLVRPRAGDVQLQGRSILGLDPQQIVAAGVGYVPQVNNVFATLTVDENLDMGGYLMEDAIDAAKERVLETFPLLRERRRQRVGTMSGGERQMVAIARALMPNPRALLLDEPTAALAPKLQVEVLDRLRVLAETGTPVLLVEQNAKAALARSDRGYVLEQGRNKYEGRGRALLRDGRVGRLYLGG